MQRDIRFRLCFFGSLAASVALGLVACANMRSATPPQGELASGELADGQAIFRYDTFGDEPLWTDKLKLHRVIDESLQPLEALRLGLKVDVDKLELGRFVEHNPLAAGGTRELLRQNAVVGVQAHFEPDGHISRIGITCALCHSTVDDSMVPGIGHRRDGWPNRDLDVGKIIAMSPEIPEDKKAVYRSWGKGRYDPRFNIDGKNTPLVLPPAYGLAAVKNETYTAEAPISYWNAYVAVTQMGGQGNFVDPRLGIEVHHTPDLVTPKLAALRAYQHSLAVPQLRAGEIDQAQAESGHEVFNTNCASCHVGGNGTDNDKGVLHTAAETGMDGSYAARTITKQYRTTPLRGLWQHPPYFHDGSAATLKDVVAHYDQQRNLHLSATQQRDLAEFLKTL